MSYARLSSRLWEREHYSARWSAENPASEGWAAADAAWMMDRLDLPGEREVAAAWGWKRTRTADFLRARLAEQIADEPRAEKREALAKLRLPKDSGRNAAKTPEVTQPKSGQPTSEQPPQATETPAETRPISGRNAAETRPRARDPLSSATATATAEDPSGGVAGATEPKPDPAAEVYRAWRQTHPRCPERPSPDSRKACTRILAECGTLAAAVMYVSWVADSGDERAAQLRGQAPWPDGARLRRDDLESLSRHIPSRLPMVLAWDERGRRPADRSAPPRATSPPPPSNRIAAAEADRQARTRRLLAESADPFAPALTLTGEAP